MSDVALRPARRVGDPSPDAPLVRPGRTVPAPRRPGTKERRPPLTVLPRGYRTPRSRRRRRRIVAGFAVVAALAGIFGLVLVHVELTAHQLQLVRLERQADTEQERYLKLRLEVAQLQSPQRIVDAAQKLGMVTPTTITYLTASEGGGGGPGAEPPASPGNAQVGPAQTNLDAARR